jgi:hypothetical protein
MSGITDSGNFDRPLVLFCSPRGGSSLVAGAFVNHGFWVGKTFGGPDGVGTGGYINYENRDVKAFMKKHWSLDAGNHDQNVHAADLRTRCEQVVPSDALWLFKGVSEYYPVWRHHFPQMRAVMVFRDETQAVEAHVRRRGEKVRRGAESVVERRYRFMNNCLMLEPLTWRVDADRLVDGDSGQLAPILAEYDIDLDHRLAVKHINPLMFHK